MELLILALLMSSNDSNQKYMPTKWDKFLDSYGSIVTVCVVLIFGVGLYHISLWIWGLLVMHVHFS